MKYDLESATGGTLARLGIALIGLLLSASAVRAQETMSGKSDQEESRIERGLAVAPVSLNMRGKNRSLVGLGSYLVNVSGDCNGCYSAGPETEYVFGGIPYFRGQGTKAVNPSTYLGGGRSFGQLAGPGSPEIISRNLTPDKTGMPAGGRPFAEFLQILRTGIDLDNAHPNCSSIATTNCFPPPWDGTRLQVMPWPQYQDLTLFDIRAIYEYLSAIPCVEGPPTGIRHNSCR
jgi:hypothetical protein